MALTQANERVGLLCLSTYDWKLEVAIDHYFQDPSRFTHHGSPSYQRPSIDRKKLDQLFSRYKGEILTQQYEQFSVVILTDTDTVIATIVLVLS